MLKGLRKLFTKKPKEPPLVEPTAFEIAEATLLEVADRVAAGHRTRANDIHVESATLRAKLMAKATAIDEFVHELRAELARVLHEEVG